ncbi:MAG: TonB-dependent receptor [Acidobacteria bacterium]|nr:TonB-dependent receptor [Acidobacteriota bacterium]
MRRRPRRLVAVLMGTVAWIGITIPSVSPAVSAAGAALAQSESAEQTIAPTPVFVGMTLAEALKDLQGRGLKIVFTTNVVRPGMRVETEPLTDPSDLRAILDELLAAHGLESRNVPNQTLVIVPDGRPRRATESSRASISGIVRSRRDTGPIEGVHIRLLETDVGATSSPDGSFAIPDLAGGPVTLEIRRRGFVVETVEQFLVVGRDTQLDILLDPAPITEEEVIVTPSRISLLRSEPVASVALSRDAILALPHLGDDFFRALSLLPGIAANDASAQFNIRGGRRDETQIILDGQELYETFHLKEFDDAQSIIAPTTLESVDLSTGSFSAEHGDRMGGVLDMKTHTPTGATKTRLGIGILGAEAGGSGTFKDRRGSWIAQGRRGSNEFAGKLIGPERPLFWDAFAKLDFQVAPRHVLRANFLHSDDEFDFSEVTADGEKHLATEYLSSYLWLTDQFILGPRLFFESALSSSRVERDRNGIELDEDVQWSIADRRDLEVLALRQAWNFQVMPDNYLKWGFEIREFDTLYDYASTFNFDVPLAQIRTNAALDAITFEDRFEESHKSLYVTDRLQLGDATTLELGLRFDDHSQTDESHLTPRLNLARSFGGNTVFRAAWGQFNQSQRPYELAVEDGDTAFRKVERSEHRLLGFEHLFQSTPKAGLALRVELYQREIYNPQPRWENLYEPLNEFQEVEPDRLRVVPDRSYAEGIELFLRGRAGANADWFVNYTLASSEDEINGRRQHRALDQTHSLNLDFDYRVTDSWTLNLAWRHHTGWPTTPLDLQRVIRPPSPGEEDEEGEPLEPQIVFVPVLGEPFGARLSNYHRLDLRASRRWHRGSGLLTFFVDIQNLYDRKNLAGFDYEIDGEEGILIPNPERWGGFFPSLGIRWEF